MNAQDRRFLHGALLEGPVTGMSHWDDGSFPSGSSFRYLATCRWPFGTHKGLSPERAPRSTEVSDDDMPSCIPGGGREKAQGPEAGAT